MSSNEYKSWELDQNYREIADHIGIIAGGVLGYEGELRPGESLEQLFMDVVKHNQQEV